MPSKPKNAKYTYFRPVQRPTDYYRDYNQLMDEQDKEMLKSMNSNLDILLTFAGLFSGVNSGFIALSLALFNPSSSDTTHTLLRLLVTHVDNSTLTHDELFPSASPSPAGTTRVNCLFSASLVISLIVSLGSIIGKQWLIYYDRSGDVDPFQDWKTWRPLGSEHRGRVRYRKLHGLKEWRLRAILEAWLPMLLQLSVLIFFAGLIDFLHILNPIVAWVTLAIAALGVAAYVYTVQAAANDPDCPFQTPVSTLFLPWLSNAEWTWTNIGKRVWWFMTRMAKLFRWLVSCIFKLFVWIWHRLAELCCCLSACLRRCRGSHDRNDPLADAENPDTVSAIDIQVTAWMLSTALKPDILRSAAGSLPLVHVPGELTSMHVDQSAISHLLFLFRDSAELLTECELHQSSKGIPDAIIYSWAAFHLFISSFIQSHTITPFNKETISWWAKYSEILGLAISRKPAGLLRIHDRLVRLIRDGNQGSNIFNEPPKDPQSIPLYMAGLVTAWISCAFVHNQPELFQIGDFWKSIRECLEGVLTQRGEEVSSSIGIPWNAINLVAWALSEFHELERASSSSSPETSQVAQVAQGSAVRPEGDITRHGEAPQDGQDPHILQGIRVVWAPHDGQPPQGGEFRQGGEALSGDTPRRDVQAPLPLPAPQERQITQAQHPPQHERNHRSSEVHHNPSPTGQSALSHAWNAYTSDEDIGKHIVDALANYEERTNVSDEYRRDVQVVYAIILNALPSLAKEAQGSLKAELRTAQDRRISIAKQILGTFPNATASMSLQATPPTLDSQPANPDDDEAGRLAVLEAALKSLFIDEQVMEHLLRTDVEPFWEAVLHPLSPKLHRVLLDFLQNCLKNKGVATSDARAIFDHCRELKNAVIQSTSHTDERIQIAALQTLRWMMRYASSRSEEEAIVTCLATAGTREGFTFDFPEARQAICEAVKEFVSQDLKYLTHREVLSPFCTQARNSSQETSAVETMLAVWQTCRFGPAAEDQQPEWMDAPTVTAVANHVEWRIGTYGLGAIAHNLRDYWDMVLTKSPLSLAATRLREILSPTITAANDEPENQTLSTLTNAGGHLTPDGQSGQEFLGIH
ncbi:hypothetical protein FRB99_008058 [Tulasnella sp. 403]|nr:hypothetical protein FRB99_008058 [Tulasnella sp. 403]